MGSKAYPKIMGASMMRKAQETHAFQVQPYLDTAGVARKIVEFLKGRKIFTQGDPSNTVLYVQEGTVKLTVVNEKGKEAVIALLGAGDFLGEGCISNGSPVRMATATAMAPTAPAILTSPGRRAKPIQRFLQTIIRSAKQSGGRAATPVALVPKTPQTQHSPAAPQRTYR